MEPEEVFQILCNHLNPKALRNLQCRDLAISFTHQRISYTVTCSELDEVVACVLKIGLLCFGFFETHRFETQRFYEEWRRRQERGESALLTSSRLSIYRKPPTLRDLPF